MTAGKSMADVAYDIMSKKKRSIAFNRLWADVSKITGAGNDHVAQFYSDLILDPRFVNLKENKWDLSERRKYSESHIDISELELTDDDEEEEEEREDDEEEEELLPEEDEY